MCLRIRPKNGYLHHAIRRDRWHVFFYNEAVRAGDIFVSLVFSKAGKG